MLGKLTRQPSKLEAFKRLLNITCLCIDSWFNLQEGVADFGHKIRWCTGNLLLPTVYIWECYQHLLWPCPLSIPSQAHKGSLTHSMVLERKATHSNLSNWCKNTKIILICSNVFQGHVKQPNIHTPIEVGGVVIVFYWRCLIHMLSRHLMSYKNLAVWPLHVLNINRYQRHLIEGGSSPATPSRHTWSLATGHETISKGVLFDARSGNLVWIPRVEMILFQVSQHSESRVSRLKPLDPNELIHGFFGIYNKERAISLYRVQVICGFTWESVSPSQFFQCWTSRVVACILGISYRNFSANCLILEHSGGNRLCNDITHKPWLPNYPPRVLSQQTNEFVAWISLSEINTTTIWIRKLSPLPCNRQE